MPNRKKVRVAIHASYYNVNYGDSLLMIRVANQFIDTDSGRIELWFPFMADSVERDVSPYLKQRIFRGVKGLFNLKLLVLCGGGYFGEPPNNKFKWSLNFIRRHFFAMLPFIVTRKKICAIGLGAGPVRSVIVRWCMRFLLEKSSPLIVRDPESASFVGGLSSKLKDKVCVASDLAQDSQFLSNLANHPNAKVYTGSNKYIAIHLSLTDKYAEHVCSLLESLLDSGFHLNFFTDGPGHNSIFEDESYYLYEFFSHPDASCFSYDGVASTTRIIYKSRGVLTSKLHVGIVSATFGLPIFSMPTHPKTYRYFNQIGRTDSCIFLDDSDEVVICKRRQFLEDVRNSKHYDLPDSVVSSMKKSLDAAVSSVLL